MMNNLTIQAKVDLDKDTFKEIVDAQKDIELATIAAVDRNVAAILNLALVAQQARIAEANARIAEYEVEGLKSRVRIAEAEAEKAKYAVESAAADAAFRKASSAKKPYVNGVG